MNDLNNLPDERTDPNKMLQDTINKNLELNKKLGYAIGAIEGTLLWYIPSALKEKLNKTLAELKDGI